nr:MULTISPECIES: hypothetical protein [unclassified Moorena]
MIGQLTLALLIYSKIYHTITAIAKFDREQRIWEQRIWEQRIWEQRIWEQRIWEQRIWEQRLLKIKH